MISDRNSGITVNSTFTGDKVALSIDHNAMSHIMNVLTNLYSNPILAVIREYCTNAYDAHIAAGVTRPIEVFLPSGLSPFLRIRDYGSGLSVEDIHEIYSRYGASTKRDTNTQVGMLGLGCKSGLTYTSQFTLTSVKDGVRVKVSVSRDDDGSGSMTIIDTSTTTDESGVEILIPVRSGDTHRFESEAARFFSYWKSGTVLVNGKSPKRVDGTWVSDDMVVTKNRGDNVVVMGNVAYPMANMYSNAVTPLNYSHSLVAFVPIGAVDFTPSREALHMTTKTKQTLEKISVKLRDNYREAAKKDIEKAAHAWDAIDRSFAWSGAMSIGSVTWHGHNLPVIWKPSDSSEFLLRNLRSDRDTVARKSRQLAANYMSQTIWFYNFTDLGWSHAKTRRLNEWLGRNPNYADAGYAVMLKDKPTDIWIDPSRIFNWDDVKSIKLEPMVARTRSGHASGSYKVYTDRHQRRLTADEIDTSLPIYYLDSMVYDMTRYMNVINRFESDAQIVVVPTNRLNKFKRLFPDAEPLVPAIQRYYISWTKGISKIEEHALSRYLTGTGSFKIDPNKVDDPALKEMANLNNVSVHSLLDIRKAFARAGMMYEPAAAPNPMAKYTLFNQPALVNHPNHMYAYLNAAYNTFFKENENV